MSSIPSAPVRVLVVDDSAYLRHTLRQRLNQVPGIQVVGTAPNGAEALAAIPTLNPDVVTLDVEMPGLDGVATLREIMARCPRPVIMLSSLTTMGATITVQALLAGAVDFVTKPNGQTTPTEVLEELVTKIQIAARARQRAVNPALSSPELPNSAKLPQSTLNPPKKVVVIGASTGGPSALATLLSSLTPELPIGLLLVQHMPLGFTRALAERLNSLTPFRIKEAEAGDRLEVGMGLLAPAGSHMQLDAWGHIVLAQTPTLHGVRPAVDVTMEAAAHYFRRNTIGVILTGMGKDGTLGARYIRAAGGQVLAEAEASCVVWGMPRSAIEAGVVNKVVPLSEMAKTIQGIVSYTRPFVPAPANNPHWAKT